MQHVLRCWERQFWRHRIQENPSAAGAPPRTSLGSLQRSRKPPSWWGGADCPLPENSIPPPLSALRASPLLPHSKISSDAVGEICQKSRTNKTWSRAYARVRCARHGIDQGD